VLTILLGGRAAARRLGGAARRLSGRARKAGAAALRGRRVRRLRGREVEEFLQVARQSFLGLQRAWDAGDLRALSRLAARPLLDDLEQQLRERGPGLNRTDVLSLQARLLGCDELQQAYLASVEFSGTIRENGEPAPRPFRELWMLAKIKAPPGQSSPWQLARIQSLT
jgi:predicted lipid-binding transport protein (Tim44 family)